MERLKKKILFSLIASLVLCNYASVATSAETTARVKKSKNAEKIKAQEVALAEEPRAAFTYRIGEEDRLEVHVWQHPELTREVIVRPDGMISFPLLGEIRATGLTLLELRDKVTQGFSEFNQKRRKLSVPEETQKKEEYLIRTGDTLDVSVWRIPDLSREVIVRPDGMISFPLIGDMQATGKTLTKLDEELTGRLSDYVKDPQVSIMIRSFGWKQAASKEIFLEDDLEVSVMIKEFGGKKVIVLGEIRGPGVYTLTGKTTILKAIALAGGFTADAVVSSVIVIEGGLDNPKGQRLNLTRAIKKNDIGQNIVLKHEDIVYVPKKFIANVNYFATQIVGPLSRGATGTRDIEVLGRDN